MPQVEVRRVVSSQIDQVWETVSNIKSYPSFMPSVRSVEILEGDSSHSTKSKWSVILRESIMEWVEIDQYKKEEGKIEFCQTQGDLEMLQGSWQLHPVSGGTEIRLLMEFKIGIPSIEELLTPIAVSALEENCKIMLDSIDSRMRTA